MRPGNRSSRHFFHRAPVLPRRENFAHTTRRTWAWTLRASTGLRFCNRRREGFPAHLHARRLDCLPRIGSVGAPIAMSSKVGFCIAASVPIASIPHQGVFGYAGDNCAVADPFGHRQVDEDRPSERNRRNRNVPRVTWMRDFVLPADSLAGQTFEINPANPATGSVERLTFTQGTQHRL